MLESLENMLGSEHPLVAEHLGNIARHYGYRRRRRHGRGHRQSSRSDPDPTSALRCHGEALSILRGNRSRALLFDDHSRARRFAIDAAVELSGVGDVLREIGDLNGAAVAYRECMDFFLEGSRGGDDDDGDEGDGLAQNLGFRAAVRGASRLLREMRYVAFLEFVASRIAAGSSAEAREMAIRDVEVDDEAEEVSLLSMEEQVDLHLTLLPIATNVDVCDENDRWPKMQIEDDDDDEEVDAASAEAYAACLEEEPREDGESDFEEGKDSVLRDDFPRDDGSVVSETTTLSSRDYFHPSASRTAHLRFHSCLSLIDIDEDCHRPSSGLITHQSVASADEGYEYRRCADASPSPPLFLLPLEERLRDALRRLFPCTTSVSSRACDKPVAFFEDVPKDDQQEEGIKHDTLRISNKRPPCYCKDKEDQAEIRHDTCPRRDGCRDDDSYGRAYQKEKVDCEGGGDGHNIFSTSIFGVVVDIDNGYDYSHFIQDQFINDSLDEDGPPLLILTPTGTDDKSFDYDGSYDDNTEDDSDVREDLFSSFWERFPSLACSETEYTLKTTQTK